MKKFKHDFLRLPKISQINGKRFRVYETPDGIFPSVTTILSHTKDQSGLIEWKKRIGVEKAEEISRRACERGEHFHFICEKFLRNEKPPNLGDPESQMMFESMKPFLIKHVDQIRLLEGRCFSKKLRVAGTIDCVADFDEEFSIIDFKTTRSPKKEDHIEDYFIQAAVYAFMIYESIGEIPKQIVIMMAGAEKELGRVQIFKRETREFLRKAKRRVDKFFEMFGDDFQGR